MTTDFLDHCLDEATLMAAMEGDLGEAALDAVEQHIDRCDACREFMAAVARTTNATAGAVEAAFSPGERCGPHLILHRLGAGGMGVVYAAWDQELDRKVALKVVLPGSEVRAQQRLVAEAKAMAAVRHPNVVTVFEVGEVEAGVYIAMEYLPDGTLRDWLDVHPEAPWSEVLAWFVQAGRGLVAAHEAGIVHRDFKPDNVLLDGERACVADFGLARANAGASTQGGTPVGTKPAGTPAYMAPEQRAGTAVGPAADQYALCVALWEALFGVLPHASGAERRRPSEVPDRVRKVLERGLQEKPEARFPSVAALLGALQRESAGRPWAALGVAVVGVAAAIAGWSSDNDPCAHTEDAWAQAWNDAERERLRGVFEATDVPYASQGFEQFEGRVDGYVREWVDAATDVCVHPERPHALERRRCLDAARKQGVALFEAIDTLQPEQIELTVRAAVGLPPVRRCESPDWRFSEEEVADVAAQVDALELLAHLRSPALPERVAEVEGRVEALGHAGVRARMAFIQGFSAKSSRDVERALERFRLAAHLAMTDDLPHERFDAVLQLALTEAQQGRFEWAEHWLSEADAIAERMGPRSRFTASAVGERGLIQRMRGHFGPARDNLRRAVDLFHSERLADVPARLFYERQLAGVLSKDGGHDEAVSILLGVLEETRALYGPGNPRVASVHSGLATAYSATGDLDQSLASADESIRLLSVARANDDIQAIGARAERGVLLLRMDPADARVALTEALDALGGPTTRSPIALIVRDALARAYARSGDHANAMATWTAALADMGQLEASDIGMAVHVEFAFENAEHGELDQARAHLQRAEEIIEGQPELEEGWATDISVGKALVALQAGSPQVATLEQAIETSREEAAASPGLAFTLFVLARSLTADDPSRAKTVAQEALAMAKMHDRVLVPRIEAWLEAM